MDDNNFISTQVAQAQKELRQRIKHHAERMIYVTFQREGIHCYPAAATDPKLKTGDQYDVSFLGYPHRHIFHFNIAIQVFHNDRDLEFIQFKRWLEGLYGNDQNVLSLNNKSCEMICDDLYDIIATRYPNRTIKISVSEDGENGATINYDNIK